MRSLSVNTQDSNSLSLDAGELVHQISILEERKFEDASGPTVNYVPLLTTYAKIEINRATDLIREGEVTTHTWLRISIWYQPEIAPDMHVEALNGRYIIQGIENVLNMNVVLLLDCIQIRWDSPSTTAGNYGAAVYGTHTYN